MWNTNGIGRNIPILRTQVPGVTDALQSDAFEMVIFGVWGLYESPTFFPLQNSFIWLT